MAQLLMGEALDARAEFNREMLEAVPELFRQVAGHITTALKAGSGEVQLRLEPGGPPSWPAAATAWLAATADAASKLRIEDRKSTRLNSSHITISYAVFCLKKKKKKTQNKTDINKNNTLIQ